MGLVSPARGMQVWRVEGKYLGTQAHGRRHTGGFPIDLGGIAGETALVRAGENGFKGMSTSGHGGPTCWYP